jgi:hypothetical protein
MTIDMNLNVLPMPDRAFLPGVGMRILDDRCIVEVKYRKQLPAVFKELSEKFGLQVQKVSKFRNGLRLLELPAADQRRRARGAAVDGKPWTPPLTRKGTGLKGRFISGIESARE